MTNNFNYFVGDHVVTIGTQNTFSAFKNLFIRNFYGFYNFDSIEDLRNGEASEFERNYSAISGEDRPLAEFTFANFSLYAQDEWTVSPELKLTGGLRLDMAQYFDSPTESAGFETAFGFDNSEVPNGNIVFSPRLGFNYDLGAQKQTQLRGGAGIFSGRNPAVWISNSFSNDGTLLNGVSVESDDLVNGVARGPIAFRADPDNQYVAEDFGQSQGSAEINLTDPDFVSPVLFRTNLAVDQQLPAGFVATVEGLYSDVIKGVQWQSLNRAPFVLDPNTVDGRNAQRRARVSDDYQDVVVLTNTDQGYTYNVTGQLRKQAGTGIFPDLSASLAYTYSQATDVNSATSSQARSNVRDLEVGLDVNDPPASTSDFELAHRVLGQVSYRLQYGGRFGTTFSLLYEGQSGSPFSWIYSRGDDLNGDGFDRADLIYVPASRDEVVLVPTNADDDRTPDQIYAELDAFIEANDDLRDQRGQIVDRNSGRAPWNDFLDARITQQITTLQGQKVELTLDIENLLLALGLVARRGPRRGLPARHDLVDFNELRPTTAGKSCQVRGARGRTTSTRSATSRRAGGCSSACATRSSRTASLRRSAAPLSLEGGAAFFVRPRGRCVVLEDDASRTTHRGRAGRRHRCAPTRTAVGILVLEVGPVPRASVVPLVLEDKSGRCGQTCRSRSRSHDKLGVTLWASTATWPMS